LREIAVLLTHDGERKNVNHVEKALRFFGVSPCRLTASDFLSKSWTDKSVRLLASADELRHLVRQLSSDPEKLVQWRRCVDSAFVYPGADAASLKALQGLLTDAHPIIHRDDEHGQWIISQADHELCGPLSGLRIPTGRSPLKREDDIATRDVTASFVKAEYQSVPVLISAADVIDVGAGLVERNFDVRNHVPSAMPIAMYIKSAFPHTSWRPQVTCACLVIDDLLLKPAYGFFEYKTILDLMEKHNFTSNIAFIPWNWRRSHRKIVDMFKRHPDRFSLSIHGSDHTRAEFGTQNHDKLAAKSREAMTRMLSHQAKTGIQHDDIMVFPQGLFSGASLAALKHANFLAAVNTEVFSTDQPPPSICISDVWDVAVMRYADSPIFTRRYPAQGVENFAFDILLGKPCIIVIHHDYCRDNYRHLVDFIDRLNGLDCPLTWSSLGDVVRRSCRQREISPGVVEVEMYGSELQLENRSTKSNRYLVRKRVSDCSGIQEIYNGSQLVPCEFRDDRIHFEVEVPGCTSRLIKTKYKDVHAGRTHVETPAYKIKVRVRRYLSEIRDNYVSKLTV